MRLNPEQYDPEELRRMAAGGRRAERENGPGENGSFEFDDVVEARTGSRSGDVLRANQLEQLFVHQTADGEALEKPYLQRIPEEYAAERVVFDWLEFLVLKAGFRRSMAALRYYQQIGWISERVTAHLQEYLLGFTADVDTTQELEVTDHQLSLVYLARLASMTR